MTAGRPVIASAVGGIPEQIRHGRESILVEPGNVEALSSDLASVLEKPAEARRMGQAGRQRVSACFDFSTMLRATESAY